MTRVLSSNQVIEREHNCDSEATEGKRAPAELTPEIASSARWTSQFAAILAPLKRVPQRTKTQLKLVFSAVLFAGLFLFGKIDVSRSLQIAMQADFWCLGAAALLFLFTAFINAMRWKLLSHAVGFERSVLELTKYCFVGAFFNLFLPSTVGGDFSRSYYLSKGTGRYHHALYSVMADRVLGIAVLFLFASVGILLGPGGEMLPWQLKAPVFLGTIGIFVLVPLMPRLTLLILGDSHPIARRLNNSVSLVYWRDRQLVGLAIGQSIFMQVVMVLAHIAVGLAIGLTHIPVWYYFIFYPSVAVLGFVTPSFNGIGIREWAYTYFLTMMGVEKSHAVTYAVIWLGLITFNSLVGGLVYLLSHLRPPAEVEKIQYDTI